MAVERSVVYEVGAPVRPERTRPTRAKPWQYQIGEPPNTVTAIERIDRNRVVEVRVWVGALKRFKRHSLNVRVRNDEGIVDQALEAEAVPLSAKIQ